MPFGAGGPGVMRAADLAANAGQPNPMNLAANVAAPVTQPAAEQPISTEIRMAEGVFIKSMLIQRAGTYVPQHAHKYDHQSVVVRGGVFVWKDGLATGLVRAPATILIKANVKHLFQAETDGTTILCVHDIGTAEAVEIAEEHQIVG